MTTCTLVLKSNPMYCSDWTYLSEEEGGRTHSTRERRKGKEEQGGKGKGPHKESEREEGEKTAEWFVIWPSSGAGRESSL